MTLTFTVYGVPQPQGSARAFMPKGFQRPVITGDNEKNKPWRQEIAGTALAAMAEEKLILIARPAAVYFAVAFYFDRPKSTKRDALKTTKPDLDKLVRSCLDSLTGIVMDDDSQVTRVIASKAYGSPARAEIAVSQWREHKCPN